MSRKVAVQMDDPRTITPQSDTTFALILEAQRRGFNVAVHQPESLVLEENRTLTADISTIEAKDLPRGEHIRLDPPKRIPLNEFDVVLMRQNPPYDIAYVTAAMLLETLHPSTPTFNDPRGVRDSPEKMLVTQFSRYMPPTIIARDPEAIREFRRRHGDVVIKPLHGNAGAGVFRLNDDDRNFNPLLETFNAMFREPYVAQRYAPAVRESGDKRILLVDGEPAGAIRRFPADDDLRANLAAGGRAVAAELNERDREICDAVGPTLRERGLLLAGLDVIDGMLTEINVTSPTGARELQRLSGIDAARLAWDAIEARLASG